MSHASSDKGLHYDRCRHCDTEQKPTSVVGWNKRDVDNAPEHLPRLYHCGQSVDGLILKDQAGRSGCGSNWEITPGAARERNIEIDPRVRRGRADPGTLPASQAAGRTYLFLSDQYRDRYDLIDWSKKPKDGEPLFS